MKKLYFLLFVIIFCFNNLSFAQLSGTNVFLQGHFLEIGEIANASFGASAPPGTYHPHNGGTTWTPGAPLAMVFDYGHDGWSVGSPAFMGDYTYPGSPFLRMGNTDQWEQEPGLPIWWFCW